MKYVEVQIEQTDQGIKHDVVYAFQRENASAIHGVEPGTILLYRRSQHHLARKLYRLATCPCDVQAFLTGDGTYFKPNAALVTTFATTDAFDEALDAVEALLGCERISDLIEQATCAAHITKLARERQQYEAWCKDDFAVGTECACTQDQLSAINKAIQ